MNIHLARSTAVAGGLARHQYRKDTPPGSKWIARRRLFLNWDTKIPSTAYTARLVPQGHDIRSWLKRGLVPAQDYMARPRLPWAPPGSLLQSTTRCLPVAEWRESTGNDDLTVCEGQLLDPKRTGP